MLTRDSVTQVIPVTEGYVIGSSIKSIPIAWSNITDFVQSLLHDRGELYHSKETAQQIKEQFCYVCPDIVKEFAKFDREPERFQKYLVEQKPGGRKVTVHVGYEKFLTPETLLNPGIYPRDFLTPLTTVVDTIIQSSPIDARRSLRGMEIGTYVGPRTDEFYLIEYCSLGGSTLYHDFGRRLQNDIRHLVDTRPRKSEEKSGGVKSGGLEVLGGSGQ